MVTIGDLENNEIESIHIEGITNIPLIKGEQGEKGDKGDKGETNNIKIGTVDTGEKASATLEGESPNQILNLVLPKGDKGEQGEPGIKPVKGIDYFTEEEIQEIKSNILDQVNQFSVLVVEELPTDNIDEHTIYFVPKTKTEQNDVYDEFIYINNGWEHIGTTEVDLSSYYKKDEIDTKLEAVEGNEVYIGNEEEAPSSAKIIVEDEDFEESAGLSKSEVYVGAEEPTTGEKVWLRKGKNLFDYKNDRYLNAYLNTDTKCISQSDNHIMSYIKCNPNTTYTISKKAGQTFRIATFSQKPVIGLTYNTTIANHIGTSITITTEANDYYIGFLCFAGTEIDGDTGTYLEMYSTVQVEQNSEATTYEDYIEPKMFVRNSNGVYEEFAKKSEEVYSTEEQVIGKWIDGKPLYRKVYDGIVLSGSETIVEQTSGIIVQKIYGYFVYTTNKSIQEIGAYRAMDTASTSRVLWDGTYVKVQGGTDWQTGQYTARVIIEYTKTTD